MNGRCQGLTEESQNGRSIPKQYPRWSFIGLLLSDSLLKVEVAY